MESYLIACQGCTRHAIETVVLRAIRGEVESFSKEFAPGPAAFASAMRTEMDAVKKQIELAANRVALQDHRPIAAQRPNVIQHVADKRAQMEQERRAVLLRFDTFEAFRSYARGNRLPDGHCYLVQTGELFGAPGTLDAAAPEKTDEIPW